MLSKEDSVVNNKYMTHVTYDLKNICYLLRRDGYVHLRNWVDPSSVSSAVRAINFEIGEGISREMIEKMRVNAISFGTNRLRHSKAITDLLYNTHAIRLVEQLYGSENILLPDHYVQIALRFPQDVGDDTISYLPWHLDNVQPGGVKGFGLIVGVFLNDISRPDSGNFTVFPGAHAVLEKHFQNIAHSKSLYRNKYGRIVLPNVNVGEQHQILSNAGDIVICHHQLPHRAAPNISPNIRMAVFFRIEHKHLPFEHPVDCKIRYISMTNLWAIGWAGMKQIVSDNTILVNVDVPALCDCATKSTSTDIKTILKNHALSIPWIEGSKCSGTFEFWKSTRSFIVDAINKSGSILDIGCANGFLLACLVEWSQEKALTLTPYGIECDPSVFQCKQLFSDLYDVGHFIQIDLENFLSCSTSEAPTFPPAFDFIYWNVWVNNCNLETETEQRWLCKLLNMISPGGRLLLGLYGTEEQNDIKSKKIRSIISHNFPSIDESQVLIFKVPYYAHTLLSIDVHSSLT